MLTKIDFRKKVKELNKKYRNHDFKQEDHIIINNLIKTELYRDASTILLFYPLQNEVDVKSLINFSIDNNKKVAIPITYKDNIEFNLINSEWEKNLQLGKYNIWEPKNKSIIHNFDNTTIIIVPALAYGKDKSRIGHGKGYYDKFLTKHPSLIKIGLVRHHLLFDNVPMEKNDKYLDIIITSI